MTPYKRIVVITLTGLADGIDRERRPPERHIQRRAAGLYTRNVSEFSLGENPG